MLFAANQGRRLQTLLSYARETVPFYADAGRDLLDFPVVSKASIRANFDGFISKLAHCDRQKLISFLQQAHPLDNDAVTFDQDISVDLTSGSSGLSFCIPKTRAERVATSINIWKFRQSLDPLLSPQSFYAIIHAPKKQLTPGSYRELEAHLEQKSIRWIHAYPGYLERWAKERANDARPTPTSLCYAESTGAFLGSDERKFVESKLGLKVVNQYGCREVSVIGYALEDNLFTPLTDNVVVEIIDDSGARITATGQPGRVVVTGLHQRLLPFIRYDTGDRAEIKQLANGSHALLVHEGRPHQLIKGSQARYGSQVFKAVMIAVYKEIGLVDLSYLQIRQIAERSFVIATSPSRHAEAIREGISRHFNSYGIFPTPAEFQLEQTRVFEPAKALAEKECLFTNKHF